MKHFITLATAVVVVLLASVPGRAAQTGQADAARAASVDARWLPWIGCWRPADQRSPEQGVHICVVPAGTSGARMMTLAEDATVSDETIIPDGTERPIEEPACRGIRRSEWSRDGLRVYSSAELSCRNEAVRKVSGLSLMTANAEWIDIQVVAAGAQENVRVRRYQRSTDRPPDATLIPADLAARASTSAFGEPLRIDHIIEASGKVAPRVLEALLFETKAAFPIASRQLLALDDAGVADTVIDLMVAFSFPKKFEVRRSGGGSFGSLPWGGFGWDGLGVDASLAWPFYYNPYYSYFSPFGYNYWNYWNGYYFGPGTGIIAGGGDAGDVQRSGHGRVVNGSGYTQVFPRAPENDGQATQRVGAGDSFPGGIGAGGASSGGSVSPSGFSGGGGGGGGGDTGRTAIPR